MDSPLQQLIAHLESIACCPITIHCFSERSYLIFHTEHGQWVLSHPNDGPLQSSRPEDRGWMVWAVTTAILFAKNQST